MNLFIFSIFILIFLTLYLSLGDNTLNGIGKKNQIQTHEFECHYETIDAGDLRIMTFNTYSGGLKVNDGINKIAKHINLLNPDVVILQEVENIAILDELVEVAGSKWQAVGKPATYTEIAVFTRHQILNETFALDSFVGASIDVGGRIIRVVGVHLQFWYYGAHLAYNKMVTDAQQLMNAETHPTFYNRVDNIKSLLKSKTFQQWLLESDKIPLFVAGDFNTPSHLDWVESTKDQHAGWVFEWPATKLLENGTGLVDAYRVKYPDPAKNPGVTWSTISQLSHEWGIKEPQDRIDFIYFKDSLLNVENGFCYCGNTTLRTSFHPDVRDNDFPSDHYAVVIDFNYKRT